MPKTNGVRQDYADKDWLVPLTTLLLGRAATNRKIPTVEDAKPTAHTGWNNFALYALIAIVLGVLFAWVKS